MTGRFILNGPLNGEGKCTIKLIIAGSREINDYQIIIDAIAESPWRLPDPNNIMNQNVIITEIVSGGCRGVDLLGEQFARIHNIPIKRFSANWLEYGKSAGPIRNAKMALYGDSLLVIPHPVEKSSGSWCMVGQMKKIGKPIFIYKPKKNIQTDNNFID